MCIRDRILTQNHFRYPQAEHIHLLEKPSIAQPSDYDGDKAILDNRYSSWIIDHTSKFALAPSETLDTPITSLDIISPSNKATYLLDPDLPNNGKTLILKANRPNITWHSPTLSIEANAVTLTPGEHTITANCQYTNHQEAVHIIVEML